MDHHKIYFQLIEKCKNRTLIGYSEKHHITPKSLGGSNCKNNIVILTAKEHYLAHFLLTRMFPKSKEMVYSFWMMCNGSRTGRPNTNAKMYEIARELFSNTMKGRPSPNKGIKLSEETKLKISLSNKGNQSWLGKTHTEESKLKQSNSAKSRNINIENENKRREGISRNSSKIVLQYSLDGMLINEYPSVTIAAKSINSYVGSIIHAIQGIKVKKHKNYIWKYKNI